MKDFSKKRQTKKAIADYSISIADFNTCISLNDTFVFAWFNRANCYAKSLQIEKAISDYTKVLEIEPTFAQAYFNRGILYIYQNEIEKAAVDLSIAGEYGLIDAYNILNRYCVIENN